MQDLAGKTVCTEAAERLAAIVATADKAICRRRRDARLPAPLTRNGEIFGHGKAAFSPPAS